MAGGCASPASLSSLAHKAGEVLFLILTLVSTSQTSDAERKGLLPVPWYLFSVVFTLQMERGCA